MQTDFYQAHLKPYVDSESITPGRIGGQTLDFDKSQFTVDSQKITFT